MKSLDKVNINRGTYEEGILVTIDAYDPQRHLVKVSRQSDGSALEPDRSVDTPVQPPITYPVEDKKVFKASDDPAGPIVEVNSNFARLSGSPDYGFFSYGNGGNFIKGPVSIIATPDQVRLSALTTLNPLIVSGFASTIVTPLPTCVWAIPGADAIETLLSGVMMAATLIAAAGG